MAVPRLISCALALATLTLSGCTTTLDVRPGGQPVATGVAGPGASVASPAPVVTAEPTPTTLTADAYGERLGALAGPVGKALTSVGGARTVKTLGQRLERAEEALREAAVGLEVLAPPPEVQVQHAAYVAGLRELSVELGTTRGKLSGREVCTASGVFDDLAGPLKTLDAAGETLERMGGHPADVVAAKVGAKQNRRLPNGRFIRGERRSGRGSLKIHNGDKRDSVVTVMRGGTKAFSVYVRKKSRFKVSGVRDGNYRVYFTHGVDWDARAKAFTRNCRFERFEDTVRFKTTYTATQVRWHDWQITLHSLVGGNAPTKDVDPSEFPG